VRSEPYQFKGVALSLLSVTAETSTTFIPWLEPEKILAVVVMSKSAKTSG
jgi:hypothetical protein